MTDLSPSRTGLLAQTPWRSPGSRAHCFLTCADSSTTPSPAATRDLSQLAGLAFPQAPKGRHSDITFRSSITLPASTSVYASLSLLTVTQARLKAGMKSLLLFRRALSSPTMCRFIPALGAPYLARFWRDVGINCSRTGNLRCNRHFAPETSAELSLVKAGFGCCGKNSCGRG
jgi:hypothetical protein